MYQNWPTFLKTFNKRLNLFGSLYRKGYNNVTLVEVDVLNSSTLVNCMDLFFNRLYHGCENICRGNKHRWLNCSFYFAMMSKETFQFCPFPFFNRLWHVFENVNMRINTVDLNVFFASRWCQLERLFFAHILKSLPHVGFNLIKVKYIIFVNFYVKILVHRSFDSCRIMHLGSLKG